MPIPDFQSTFLPILQFLKDGKVRTNQEIYSALENEFQLTEEEKRELLPSGKQRLFVNRVAWGKSYLKQSGLIDSEKRGCYFITRKGLSELEDPPKKITVKYLLKYPEFREFKEGKPRGSKENKSNDGSCEEMTPQEHMEFGYQKIVKGLANDLRDKIKECHPRFFEQLVVDLLLAMGYGGSEQSAASLTERGADEGIDGIINEDKLGLDIIYVQAKRWTNTIGRPEIQRFAGALHGKKARKGIFITMSDFSKDALEYVHNIDTKIVLINGQRLSELMIRYNIGVDISEVYELKKINLDYFIED